MSNASGSHALRVTDATFDADVTAHRGLVMVDFGAEWCAPCRVISPVVERLAAEYAGRARVATLDVDANPATMTRFDVRSLPTLLFFRDGQVVDRVVGAVPKATLEARLTRHLAQPAA
jgi:thioredoxin 1